MYYDNDNGYAEMEAQWAYEKELADKTTAKAEYEMELAEEDNRQQKLRNFAREILTNHFITDCLSNDVDNRCLAEDYIQLVMFAIDETSKKINNETYGGNKMKVEYVAYFDKLIQEKLEQLPRAIEGKEPFEVLNEICQELRILKNARERK